MDTDNDCECPHCDDPDCNLNTCRCIRDTSYNITLQSDDSINYKLCLPRVKHDMDGMYIQLYQDLNVCLLTVAQATFPLIYRLYVGSYRIDIGNSFSMGK